MSVQQKTLLFDIAEFKDAFEGLRHWMPEELRMIRAALDVGVPVDDLKASVDQCVTKARCRLPQIPEGNIPIIREHLKMAIDYMAGDREAGAIVWINGRHGRWNWKDRHER